jgi:hypothetical protein
MLFVKWAHPSIQCYLENSRFYWKIASENSLIKSGNSLLKYEISALISYLKFGYPTDFSSRGIAS